MKIKSHIMGLSYRLMKYPRMGFHQLKARKNNNKTPTIICNNCTAGFLLHDLSLQFRTPTINTLFYNFEDFFLFVQNLKEAQSASLHEVKTDYPYPVAEIELREGSIRIGFVHYHTFEEAEKCWKKRFERINYSNVYVLYEGKISESEVDKFSLIKYKKAIMSYVNGKLESKYCFYHGFKFYNTWYPGKVGDYKSLISLKRHLDDFDYISFIKE